MVAKSAGKKVTDHFIGFLEMLYKDIREKMLLRIKHVVHRKLLEAQQRLVGQSIAVLGPPAAGKTTLLKVFKNPNVDEEALGVYQKTEVSPNEAFKVDFMLTLSEGQQFRFHFKVRKNADVGGEEYIRDGSWKDVVRDATVIVYVVDWEELSEHADGEYKRRVRNDFEWILQNTQMLKPGFKVVLVGNKIDRLCTAENFRTFRDEHQPRLNALRGELMSHWPEHLSNNVGPALLISLRSKTLRQFTLNALMLSFVGSDLDALLRESMKGSDES